MRDVWLPAAARGQVSIRARVDRAKEGDGVTCVHHWVIATPNGPFCQGKCKKCGRSKRFPTTVPETIWDGKGGTRKGTARPFDQSIKSAGKEKDLYVS